MKRDFLQEVKVAAASRWVEILSTLGGIRPGLLDGRHHPCPKCGGKDRFRMMDRKAGAVICNKCFDTENGDGFAAIMWARGVDFKTALREVGSHCGVESPKYRADPSENLEFRAWNDAIVSVWCAKNPPITIPALLSVGARLATYRGQYTVICLPIVGELLDRSQPVGWCIYEATGADLPTWIGKQKTMVKVLNTAGSRPGIITNQER